MISSFFLWWCCIIPSLAHNTAAEFFQYRSLPNLDTLLLETTLSKAVNWQMEPNLSSLKTFTCASNGRIALVICFSPVGSRSVMASLVLVLWKNVNVIISANDQCRQTGLATSLDVRGLGHLLFFSQQLFFSLHLAQTQEGFPTTSTVLGKADLNWFIAKLT